MKIEILGREAFEIKSVVFDYNGTIAVDGKLLKNVSENINKLASDFKFYVITADTYGTVKKELENTNCEVIVIGKQNQDKDKLEFVKKLGSKTVLSVGNGRNDLLMLEECVLGIAILQDEGLCTKTFLSSDILVKSIDDVFGFLKDSNRLIATLRN